MSRPITFPKTAEGEWTNRESGVRIVKTSGSVNSHEVRLASANIVGWSHAGYASSLPKARVLAKQVAERVREQIATAYVEAISEHIDRSEAEAKKVDAPTWRLNAARRSIVSERFRSALYDVQRAGVLIEIYRKRQAEADEARRTEQMDRFCEQYGYRGARTPGAIARLVEFAHASALTCNLYINDLATAYEQGVDATIEVVNASTDWVGSAVRAELQRREEKREQDYDRAAEDRAAAHAAALRTEAAIQFDATRYEQNADQVVAAINAEGGFYANAVRAEIQRREEKRERDYDHAGEVIAEARVTEGAVPQRGPLYLPDSFADKLPERGAVGTGTGKSQEVSPPSVADIPDEALAMNAGFDLAAAQPITPAHAHGADFVGNVRRFQ